MQLVNKGVIARAYIAIANGLPCVACSFGGSNLTIPWNDHSNWCSIRINQDLGEWRAGDCDVMKSGLPV